MEVIGCGVFVYINQLGCCSYCNVCNKQLNEVYFVCTDLDGFVAWGYSNLKLDFPSYQGQSLFL